MSLIKQLLLPILLLALITLVSCDKIPKDTGEGGPQSRKAFDAAIKSLKKLQSIASAGASYAEYSTRLLDAKIDFDSASPDQIENKEARQHLLDAMETYIEARDFWNKCVTTPPGKRQATTGWIFFQDTEVERYGKYGVNFNNQSAAPESEVRHILEHASKEIALGESSLRSNATK